MPLEEGGTNVRTVTLNWNVLGNGPGILLHVPTGEKQETVRIAMRPDVQWHCNQQGRKPDLGLA
jgi:hypothetical protein